MASALLVEGIHDALGVARQEIRSLIDGVENILSSITNDLDRRMGAVLGSGGSDAERADAIIDIANAPGDRETNRSLLKFVGSFTGTIWGLSIINAGLSTSSGIVALGLGVELAPVFAILIDILIMFYCGKYCLGVIKELFGRLNEAVNQ